MHLVTIHEDDNVSVNLEDAHKYARRDIKNGEEIIKYGYPIGVATADIKKGEHVHSHNLKTQLSGINEYTYSPAFNEFNENANTHINAYVRKNGNIGIRNDIWVINTVGCINNVAEKIATENGVFAFPHPYGCSQSGEDFERTAKILCGLIKHPNAGGVLVLGLGCENTNIGVIKKFLGSYDAERIRFLNIQNCENELEEASGIISELKALAESDKRTSVPISKLKIGMKCGGSDGLSGITANPLVGKITEKITSSGGSAVLTEVPEMFGAEHILFNRCVDEEVFGKAVNLINNFKKYFISNGQPISENPSPGNKDGGITTLEEKSLGCIQKGGKAIVTDILDYGDTVEKAGLALLNGPGNDVVAITNLTAAGCHIILFTTGRGTPLGAPIPTIKISSNTALSLQKPHWIDFDAQADCHDGDKADRLMNFIIETANGKQTKNEIYGYREISIFKDGVIF
ncbi:MAG: altronate dehydratase [Eubacterium sp.]|nr:altronate dehydratase [Eubacterium sp.]